MKNYLTTEVIFIPSGFKFNCKEDEAAKRLSLGLIEKSGKGFVAVLNQQFKAGSQIALSDEGFVPFKASLQLLDPPATEPEPEQDALESEKAESEQEPEAPETEPNKEVSEPEEADSSAEPPANESEPSKEGVRSRPKKLTGVDAG